MDILKEMLGLLFGNTTIIKAKNQKLTNAEEQSIDTNQISFRLYLSKKGNINLEFMGQDQFGYYFKPIGFYTFSGDNKIESIFILKEFEESYEEIESNISEDLKKIVKFLSLEENTYIAMCSRETSNVVRNMFDSPKYGVMNHMLPSKFQVENIMSNGLQILIKTSMMGALEANLNDDENELDEEVIVMFQKNNGISMHCQEPMYHKLFEMGLFSALK